MNKHSMAALGGMLGVLLAVLLPFMLISSAGNEPAQATPEKDVTLPPVTVTVTDVATVTLPPITLPPVTLPPVTLPPVTLPPIHVTLPPIRLPGATITVPGPRTTVTHTTFVEGPTRTVGIPPVTKTVKVRPFNTGPSNAPTKTKTVTVSPTGQTTTDHATVTPAPGVSEETHDKTHTKTDTIVRYVVLGTLVSLVLAALGIFMMFMGYVIGQKDAKKNEDRFMNSLLDTLRLSKRP